MVVRLGSRPVKSAQRSSAAGAAEIQWNVLGSRPPGPAVSRREVFHEIEQRAGVKDSLARSRVGDSRSKKRLIFRKIRPERAHRRGKLQSLRRRKLERLRHEKIDPDPYAKWTARRVAAAPALQSNPVGLASRTPQAHARRPLEYPYLAVPRAHGAVTSLSVSRVSQFGPTN